ncbi:hypothetical protein AVEN_216593-1, partial [Araneus ventricosus]
MNGLRIFPKPGNISHDNDILFVG